MHKARRLSSNLEGVGPPKPMNKWSEAESSSANWDVNTAAIKAPGRWVADTVSTDTVSKPCVDCSARGICWSSWRHGREIAPFESGQPVHSRIRRGAYLYRANSDLKFLFALHSGSVKRSLVDTAGREQIVGYYHGRDLLGLEGIATGKHVCDVVALEDTEVCKIPFGTLQKLCGKLPELQSNLPN